MEKIFKQNSFSRSLINESKLGAYYTDVNHCERIGQLFKWPEDNVTVLEPSVGNAAAVVAVTKDCPNKEIYGVELNTDTYNEVKERGVCNHLLNADFLNGVKISNSKFTFVFANPPYGVHQENNERLEKLFLEKLTGYMTAGGVIAYVIPYSVLREDSFMKCFLNRFNPLVVFKFDDDEYQKFKQVVVIAVKRRSLGCFVQWRERFESSIEDLEKIPYLPELGAPIKTKVPVPSATSEIEYFTTLKFDAKAAGEMLEGSALYGSFAHKAFLPDYQVMELGNPPVPLKKDLLYLIAVSGGGQGKVGSEENNDVHLQRGVVKVIKENHITINESGSTVLKESSFSKIAISVIQNDGTITTLE